MLYLTTRSNYDAYTAYRTLGEGRGPDNGLFVPFQMPRLAQSEISALKERSFSQNVADILNLFFKARLDSWDVEFCIGRYPVKLVPMNHRIMVAETWHNPDFDMARVVRNLSSRIRGNEDGNGQPTDWAWITVRIAFLFGLFSELYRLNAADPEQPVDIALPSGDFAGPMAVWYARQMGLPVGSIICSCDDNDPAWDLLHHGELYPASGMEVPPDLERLIYETLGRDEANRFAGRVEVRRPYQLSELALEALQRGMFGAVISKERRERTIGNVFGTRTYIFDPGSAMAYGGLQDYRASQGETRTAMILAERSPVCSAETVAEALGFSTGELRARMGLT